MSFKSARLGSKSPVDWQQHEQTLFRMWREGVAIRQIAAAIPLATVSSVARHARVSGLGPHPNAGKFNTPKEAKAQNGRLGGLTAQARARELRDVELNITRARAAHGLAVALGRSHRKAEPPPPPLPSPRIIPPAKTCQWPLTDKRPWAFCDAPSEVQSYCAEHHKMAHTERATQ